jgi:hypothetical protein
MRIYAVEERNQDKQLTKYWLFDNLERAQDFVNNIRYNFFTKEGYTYTFKITDPQDRE